MQQRVLGKTGLSVSAITLGGGGIGMVWGATTEDECVETVKSAVASGINIIDVAPVYGKGKAEEVVGTAWPDLAAKPLLATKVFIRPRARSDLSGAIRRSLEGSLTRLGREQIDIFQLHNQIEPREPVSPLRLTLPEVVGTGGVLEAMQQLKEEGLVRELGFTGIARHDVVRELFTDGRLATAQLVTNILNSEGEMGVAEDGPYRDHLEMVDLARSAQFGVFGIRPFAAGSLTAAVDRSLPADHPVAVDFTFRAAAFRLSDCRDWLFSCRRSHALCAQFTRGEYGRNRSQEPGRTRRRHSRRPSRATPVRSHGANRDPPTDTHAVRRKGPRPHEHHALR